MMKNLTNKYWNSLYIYKKKKIELQNLELYNLLVVNASKRMTWRIKLQVEFLFVVEHVLVKVWCLYFKEQRVSVGHQ